MAQITRTLTFRSHDLGEKSTLVLTFDNSNFLGIFQTVFPTAFKVTTFGKTGSYFFRVTYKSNFGFTRSEIGEIVEPASTYIHINPGQETTLTKDPDDPPVYSFSRPVSTQPPAVQNLMVKNGTDTRQDIGFGFFQRPDREPTELLIFKRIGAGSSANFQFTPILGGYIISGYKEHEVLKRPISSPRLFDENLVNLPQYTDWRIEYNPGDGKYEIERDLSGYDAIRSHIEIEEGCSHVNQLERCSSQVSL